MEQIIKITDSNNGKVVSARELFYFLDVSTDFTTWCKRMFEYGFVESLDYSLIKIGERNAHNKIDYALTLSCAKEISMLQRNDRGKQARKYFIECESKLNLSLPQNYSDALRMLADTIEQKESMRILLDESNKKIESDKPKVVFADSVMGSSNSILVRQFAKDLCDAGFEIGQNRLFEWFRDNKYLNMDNEPYQQYIAQGLFEVITRAIGSGHETFTSKTTKITGKGQIYFAQKLKL